VHTKLLIVQTPGCLQDSATAVAPVCSGGLLPGLANGRLQSQAPP
jgi:hypothetical protein